MFKIKIQARKYIKRANRYTEQQKKANFLLIFIEDNCFFQNKKDKEKSKKPAFVQSRGGKKKGNRGQ